MPHADNTPDFPAALFAQDVPPRAKPSNYPPAVAHRVAGRVKRVLGDRFGLTNFGVNLTTLAPGSSSALLHRHSRQDEFVYILSGNPTLITEEGEAVLSPGMCAGFAKNGTAHCLRNDSTADVVYLEVGDRSPGDAAEYPADDIAAVMGDDGLWRFTRKNGESF